MKRIKKILITLLCCCLTGITVAQTTVDSLPQLSSDSLIVEDLRKENVTFSHDNSITLLYSGQEKFDDMFEAIRQARSSVHLEYFNFRNDSIADLLFEILAKKVKEGVEVRALFDGFGNTSNNQPLKKKHIKKRRAQGSRAPMGASKTSTTVAYTNSSSIIL